MGTELTPVGEEIAIFGKPLGTKVNADGTP